MCICPRTALLWTTRPHIITSTSTREIHCLPQIPAAEEAAARTSRSPVLLTASSLLPALQGDTQPRACFVPTSAQVGHCHLHSHSSHSPMHKLSNTPRYFISLSFFFLNQLYFKLLRNTFYSFFFFPSLQTLVFPVYYLITMRWGCSLH